LALALTLLVTFYMLFVGGAFDATVRFQVQLLNAVAAGALALVWLVGRWRQRATVRATGLEWPLVALALSQWLATLISAQPRLSAEATLNLTAWLMAFVVVCDVLASGWPRVHVINALLLVAVVVAGQAMWEVGAWYVLWFNLGQWPPAPFRLNGLLGHPNLTAAVINLLLPLVILQIATRSKLVERVLFGLLSVGLLAAEFFTSSRAGWIAGGATLGLLLAFLAWEQRAQLSHWLAMWKRWPVVGRAGSGVLLFVFVIVGGGLLWRQSQHVSHGGNLIDSRRYIWLPAWQVFTEQPLVGRGPDLYAWWYPRFDSVPPIEILPHTHSLPLHLLSGSGLVGAGAALGVLVAGAVQLWRRWRSSSRPRQIAVLAISLIGTLIHHTFDYFFTAPAFAFLFLTVAALAFAPESESGQSSPKRYSVGWWAAPLALMLGFAAFSLRATALHEQGLQRADEGRWREAALAFQSAAEADSGLTLYWAEAAYAFTRAGENDLALPQWQRAHDDYPDWAIWQATLAILQNDPPTMEALAQREPRSDLLALNAGALAEKNGEDTEARAAYQQALSRNPNLAEALFWEQTPLRGEALKQWQAAQPADTSALARGWAALDAGDVQSAIGLFEQARREAPLSNAPYLGLARAHWAAGDDSRAELFLRVGQNLPVAYVWQKIDFWVLEGDWAKAHGDRTAVMEAYGIVFSALDDYTSAGAGTYGYPKPYYLIFHRATLPSDLIPQFARADITPELEQRFLQLARWYAEDGDPETACLIVSRVAAEAPKSESEALRATWCP
jgi:O-antigen ligase/Tfp pilus assembly protein PilF